MNKKAKNFKSVILSNDYLVRLTCFGVHTETHFYLFQDSLFVDELACSSKSTISEKLRNYCKKEICLSANDQVMYGCCEFGNVDKGIESYLEGNGFKYYALSNRIILNEDLKFTKEYKYCIIDLFKVNMSTCECEINYRMDLSGSFNKGDKIDVVKEISFLDISNDPIIYNFKLFIDIISRSKGSE